MTGSIFGSSFSMEDEFNFKGKRTEIKGESRPCKAVSLDEIQSPLRPEMFAAPVLGAIPVCSGLVPLSMIERTVLGACCVAGDIRIRKTDAGFVLDYISSLSKLVDGAAAKRGAFNEEGLKKMAMQLMSQLLKNAL